MHRITYPHYLGPFTAWTLAREWGIPLSAIHGMEGLNADHFEYAAYRFA